MANNISLIEKYVPLLDETYRKASLTSDLDASPDLIKATADAKTFMIADLVLQGLGDYDRNTGFPEGDATLSWKAHTFKMDRGRSFSIDSMDNQETADLAYGRMAGEFIRSYLVPEVDAYRFSQMAQGAATTVSADLDASTAVKAIDSAMATMTDAEVPEEGRILYVSTEMYNYIKQSSNFVRDIRTDGQSNISRMFDIFDGMKVVKVPRKRFQTDFNFYDGKTDGQKAGGFIEKAGASKINFMIIHPTAVASIPKHAVPRVFPPEKNQKADSWKYDYRFYYDLFVLGNKETGIYVHTVATANTAQATPTSAKNK